MQEMNEMSIQGILSLLWRKFWIILICGIVGAGGSYFISKYFMPPQYRSEVSVYINNYKEKSQISSDDIYVSQSLALTYKEILKSNVILGKIAEECGEQYSVADISKMIDIEVLSNTEIISVKVTNQDPYQAAHIAEIIGTVGMDEIINIVNAGTVNVINVPAIPNQPISPNIFINVTIGSIIGVLIALIVIFVIEGLNTKIKTEEDIKRYFNLCVLGSIPVLKEH